MGSVNPDHVIKINNERVTEGEVTQEVLLPEKETAEPNNSLNKKNKSITEMIVHVATGISLSKYEKEESPNVSIPGSIKWTRGYTLMLVAILYIFDVGSDVVLSGKYVINGDIMFASATLGFVVFSSVLSSFVNPSSTWKSERYRSWNWKYKVLWWIMFPVYVTCGLEPVYNYFRMWRLTNRSLRVEQESKYSQELARMYRAEATNVGALKFMEATVEAIPQLALQFYIFETSLFFHDELTGKLQLINMATSLMGIVTSVKFFSNAFQQYNISQNTHVLLLLFFSTYVFRVIILIWFLAASAPISHLLYIPFGVHYLYEIIVSFFGTSGNTSIVLHFLAGFWHILVPSCTNLGYFIGSVFFTMVEESLPIFLYIYEGSILDRFFYIYTSLCVLNLCSLVIYCCFYKHLQSKNLL